MIIAAQYSFNHGKEEVSCRFSDLLPEVNAAIKAIDAEEHRVKKVKKRRKWVNFFTAPYLLTMRSKPSLQNPVGSLYE